MPFDPGQQGLETVLLCSPQEPLAILRVTAVGVGAVLEEGAVVREPFAANPAHDRWRGHGKHEVWCSYRLCSTVCEAGEVGRESVRREFHIRTTRVLGFVPLATVAIEIGEKPEGRP